MVVIRLTTSVDWFGWTLGTGRLSGAVAVGVTLMVWVWDADVGATVVAVATVETPRRSRPAIRRVAAPACAEAVTEF